MMRFVRSGWIDLAVSAGTFRYASVVGYDWSSRGSSIHADGAAIPSAYYLRFGPSDVNPSGGPNVRWHAFPLRCLSTVLDM